MYSGFFKFFFQLCALFHNETTLTAKFWPQKPIKSLTTSSQRNIQDVIDFLQGLSMVSRIVRTDKVLSQNDCVQHGLTGSLIIYYVGYQTEVVYQDFYRTTVGRLMF